MIVPLKTASVRVSFIQIMQVRVQNKGKSVWKSRYIGDVSRPSPGGDRLIIPCNILELSILKFIIISFEIMFLREIPNFSMFVSISNWRIYSLNHLMRKCFVG